MNSRLTSRLKKIRNGVHHFYQSQPRLDRLYQLIKLKICPLILLEPYFPPAGTILDLGCGQGLFALILYLGSSRRRIIGFDLDEKKIKRANDHLGAYENLSFFQKDIVRDDYPSVDAVALIDVLYLIPYEAHSLIFKKIHSCLSPNGLLILKEMDTRPRWKYLWNLAQETLAVKIIGFTLGTHFYFRPREEMIHLLRQTGFSIKVIKLDRGYCYPHIAYLCAKK